MNYFSFLARVVVLISLFFLPSATLSAGFFDDFISGGTPDVRYCDDDENCSLSGGISQVKAALDDIETDRTASEYVQDVVIYILSFVTIIGVLYIIYAGFLILIGNGDEEKVKNSRQIIVYVIMGIIIMWLAFPIMSLVLEILNTGE